MNVIKKGYYHFSETHGPNVRVNPTEAIWTNSKHGGLCVLDINLATGSSVEVRAEGTGQFAVGFIEASKLTDETTNEMILQKGIGWKRYTFRNKTKMISIRRLSSLEVIFVMGKEEISQKFLRAVDEEDGLLPVLDVHWGDMNLNLESGNVALSSIDDKVQGLPMQIFKKTENVKLSPDGGFIRLQDPYPWCLCTIQNPVHECRDLVLECRRSVNSKSAFIEVFMTNKTPADLSNNEDDKSLLPNFP